jgi:ATP-dependent Lon protease
MNGREADASNRVLEGVAEEVAARGERPAPTEDVLHALPIVPMRNAVLFPATVAPLTIGRSATLQMLEEHLPVSKRIGLLLQRSEHEEQPGADGLYRTGVLATVVKMLRPSRGRALIFVEAERRIEVQEFVRTDPYFLARVALVTETPVDMETDYWQAQLRNLRQSAGRLIDLLEDLPPEARQMLEAIDDPGVLADLLAANLSLDLPEKQGLLEERQVGRRLERVQQHVDDQLRIGELQQKLRADVKTELSESQKRAYLREQMRVIQRELGEEGGAEEQAEQLRQRLKDSGLPEHAWTQAERELKRLETLPAASPEHGVIVTWLDTLADLPWAKLSEDVIDLERARVILDRDHYGLEKVKKRLIEFLAVRKLNPEGHTPILCLLGPPGVGKTSLGQSVADALGRRFVRMSLGGIRDEAEIRGHRRTYIGAMPGRIIQEMRRAGTRNPVFMLDEIDKVGSDFRGDPASALLEVLDPAQNKAFSDRYLDIDFDLSQVIFIATCNTLSTVPGPLRDRMEVIDLPGYTEFEKVHIARGHLVRRQLAENGLEPEQCQITDEALMQIIRDYTREAGVRELERRIGAICRSVAARIVGGDTAARTIGPGEAREILGAPVFVREEQLRTSAPGVVTGLAYTPVGGEVLYIEAIKYPGKGKIMLTGQLGDVMQESVRAAMSLLRSRAGDLGIPQDELENNDLHVHVPAGAIPKDGPSAGVAMFTALVSVLSGRSVNREVAMTGEISLRGVVLPIGGLKAKTIAALRAGIRKVIIPKLNEKDLPELPAEVRDHLEFVPVEKVEEVLEHALLAPDSTAQPAR